MGLNRTATALGSEYVKSLDWKEGGAMGSAPPSLALRNRETLLAGVQLLDTPLFRALMHHLDALALVGPDYQPRRGGVCECASLTLPSLC